MWRKEDGSTQASTEEPAGSLNSTSATKTGTIGGSSRSGASPSPKAAACISQGIRIKGELNGTEDLFLDGNVDGRVSLGNATLTVGPNATVKAEISARDLVVRGRVEGKLTANERIQIWSTARIQGDMKAERISIEEGAELHGKLEAGRPSGSTVVGTGNPGTLKKAEANKSKDASGGDEKTAPGAAVAGAD
jgi:cytoskeletal protein CcmA (bactofilin family)